MFCPHSLGLKVAAQPVQRLQNPLIQRTLIEQHERFNCHACWDRFAAPIDLYELAVRLDGYAIEGSGRLLRSIFQQRLQFLLRQRGVRHIHDSAPVLTELLVGECAVPEQDAFAAVNEPDATARR